MSKAMDFYPCAKSIGKKPGKRQKSKNGQKILDTK